MAERQFLIEFGELREVEITCVCGTGLVISALSNAPQLKRECPGCGRPLAFAADAVLSFREFYAKAKEFIEMAREDSNPVKPASPRMVKFRVIEPSL